MLIKDLPRQSGLNKLLGSISPTQFKIEGAGMHAGKPKWMEA